MSEHADLLVEIGTEELPPKALRPLSDAFAAGLAEALAGARLAHGELRAFATPRRLAVTVSGLATRQPDREAEQKGPPVKVAFGKDGKPTRAALAFAEKCGVAVDALARERTDKGEWLVHRSTEAGLPATGVLPGCVEQALAGLPIPRRMRWGAGSEEFVRPVHWLVFLLGGDVVDCKLFGIAAGRESRGHRFMGSARIELSGAAGYERQLYDEGRVVADLDARRERIVSAVAEAAAEAGGTPVGDTNLYDEVAALTEWPVALTGRFDAAYLELPREVIVATLTGHQRYFPITGEDGALLPAFVTVANIDSPEPGLVRDGNERVIRPRLADAAFFWNTDREQTMAARSEALDAVVYQRGLGTLADRSRRIALLAARIAAASGADPLVCERAALLAKCDLLTGMVGEFPELQGTMGAYYARADGEPQAVAEAIGEQYLPRFAGDALPASAPGRALALADKLDALCGAFASGRKPSGNRDPFGLRRAALGCVRIVVEHGLELDLPALLRAGLELQPADAAPGAADELYDFIVDRQRGWYLDAGRYGAEMFDAVRCRGLVSLADIDARLAALAGFVEHEDAEALASANKRIANILRQAAHEDERDPDPGLFEHDAERALFEAMRETGDRLAANTEARRYADALADLARLRGPVDRFFDDVMVMADDDAVRVNRLRLLAALRAQFLRIADISRLAIARG